MTVNELREALEKMPGHWPVHVAVRADGSGGGADEDFLYTLEPLVKWRLGWRCTRCGGCY